MSYVILSIGTSLGHVRIFSTHHAMFDELKIAVERRFADITVNETSTSITLHSSQEEALALFVRTFFLDKEWEPFGYETYAPRSRFDLQLKKTIKL